MNKAQVKTEKRNRRHGRIRSKITGTTDRPRLAVFRSNQFVYAQLIDDKAGMTLAAADSRKMAGENTRVRARAVGAAIAEKAIKANITKVVFDRGGFLYAGAVKELAEGAREAGLTL